MMMRWMSRLLEPADVMINSELPMADSGREEMARKIFPLDADPEEYAAREGHNWHCFSFDDYRYSDDLLTEWIQRFGDILFRRNGAPSIEDLRTKFGVTRM
jgi:hypothetical protein